MFKFSRIFYSIVCVGGLFTAELSCADAPPPPKELLTEWRTHHRAEEFLKLTRFIAGGASLESVKNILGEPISEDWSSGHSGIIGLVYCTDPPNACIAQVHSTNGYWGASIRLPGTTPSNVR